MFGNAQKSIIVVSDESLLTSPPTTVRIKTPIKTQIKKSLRLANVTGQVLL